MSEFSAIHLVIVLVILSGFLVFVFGLPYILYMHGKKVGELAGYIRGFKEGQESVNVGGAARN